ncbi:hypothetical protein [Bradyrhizobium sp. USDA 3364]
MAGAVADDCEILTTNRGAATITRLGAAIFEIKSIFPSSQWGGYRQAEGHRDRRLYWRRPAAPVTQGST